ncbi:MAG TPA: hypothetical protein VLB27_03530 [candidate division Zixibacteria bacterium]|nr:hypothetical protein [candidate division Zixibacteria bacterium]
MNTELTIEVVDDSAVDVRIVRGAELDFKRAIFEARASELAQSAGTTLAAATANPRRWWVCSAIATPNAGEFAAPTSLALALGLAHAEYIPENWLCGIVLESDARVYLTCFTHNGVYGRIMLPLSKLDAASAPAVVDLIRAALTSGALQAAPEGAALDALYALDESLCAALQERLEIPVERLPESVGALVGRGLKALTGIIGTAERPCE